MMQDGSDAGTGISYAASGFGCVGGLIYLAILAGVIIGIWKVFVKAGKPGWASIVPFYNMWVLTTEIVGRPPLWFILMLVPFANIVAFIVVALDLAKSFGKSTGFAILLIVLPFIGYPMLGFGDAKYMGPAAKQ